MDAISGINSHQGLMGKGQMDGPRGGAELTSDQKAMVTDILAGYDPANITETNAKEIFQKFTDAGITPGRGMRETIEIAGFDAEQLRQLGMPAEFQKAGRPHHDRQPPTLTDEQKTSVTSILTGYDPESLTETDIASILQEFQNAGIGPAEGLKETIETAGFNADLLFKIPHSRGSEDHFWASQNASQDINLSALQSLQSILSQYDLSNITSDQETTLIQQLQATSLFQGSKINLGI
jgi:hypothetical protein